MRKAMLGIIAALALTAPAAAQQKTTAGTLLKQGYAIAWFGDTYTFTLQKGGSAFACRFDSPGSTAEGLASGMRTASCVEITN